MNRQLLLPEVYKSKDSTDEVNPSELKILNWNIRNPSLQRAKKQGDWLIKTGFDVIILTEAKYSRGCLYLHSCLESYGFKVFFPKPKSDDYCVIVASKNPNSERLKLDINFLRHRLVSIVYRTSQMRFNIMGVYVPSRGAQEVRNVAKRKFQNQLTQLLYRLRATEQTSHLIIGGDLNVVETNHVPHHSVFGNWEYRFYESFTELGFIDAYRLLHVDAKEYSWFGRSGNGYRLDHFFISESSSSCVTKCSYIHTPRDYNFSDHSAMYLHLTVHDSQSSAVQQA